MRKKVLSLLVTMVLVAGAGFAYSAQSDDRATYRVTADVEQAPNLFDGGRVMIRGVEVGRIASVEPRSGGVRLTLEIEEAVKIPADATLAVIPITVIADRYVQLFPAYKGGGALADGDHIPLARTRIPAELDEVLGELKSFLSALEPRAGEETGPLTRLIDDLDVALDDRGRDLGNALESSASVLENLADSQSDITGLIQNLDRVFITLANRSSEIGILNERLELVLEALVVDQDNLEGTIENLAFFNEELADLVVESGDELGTSFGRLARVLRAVLRNQDALARGITWTNVIAQGLGETDGRGRGKFAYTGRQVQPGTAGAEYNYRIDVRDTIACERIGALIESFRALNPQLTLEGATEQLSIFFPDEYKDDLDHLVRLLIPLCADFPIPALDEEAQELIRNIAASVGEERFAELLARWYLEGGPVEEGGR